MGAPDGLAGCSKPALRSETDLEDVPPPPSSRRVSDEPVIILREWTVASILSKHKTIIPLPTAGGRSRAGCWLVHRGQGIGRVGEELLGHCCWNTADAAAIDTANDAGAGTANL